jgi:hypothetical protein
VEVMGSIAWEQMLKGGTPGVYSENINIKSNISCSWLDCEVEQALMCQL